MELLCPGSRCGVQALLLATESAGCEKESLSFPPDAIKRPAAEKGGKDFGDPLTGVNSLLFSSSSARGSLNFPFVAPVNPWERRLEIWLTADLRNLGF